MYSSTTALPAASPSRMASKAVLPLTSSRVLATSHILESLWASMVSLVMLMSPVAEA